MTINFHKTILSFFFTAFALIALSACGGSSGGSSGGGGGGSAGGTTGCNPLTTNCHTGLAFVTPAFDDSDYLPTRAAYTVSDTTATEDADRTRYTTVVDGSTITDAATKISEDAEYLASKGAVSTGPAPADQIRAAYAYARGHTGNFIDISSLMLNGVFLNNNELSGRVTQGYDAESKTSTASTSVCTIDGTDTRTTYRIAFCNGHQSTHLAGIMVGNSGDGRTQGIAYDAQIRPINIGRGNVFQADTDDKREKLNLAIGEASSVVDSVMNNGWGRSTTAEYDQDGDSTADYHYNTPSALSTITTGTTSNPSEREAWKTAVSNVVVVFAAGDQGHNSENGMVKLYNTDGTRAREQNDEGNMVNKNIAWRIIDDANGVRNIASAHARLASSHADAENSLKGKWLTVIALTDENRIADFSNGCGDAKLYCLGAPGVNIKSATPGGFTNTGTFSGTAQAAAHVSGAIAVLASTFPTFGVGRPTPETLVKIILNTADDLGVAGIDEVYGHGIVNLARAVDPIGKAMLTDPTAKPIATGITLDNSGITLPTSFGGALDGFTVGFIDDYDRAFIGRPTRITQKSVAFTLADTIATWESPELKNIALDSNSKMQFTNYDASEDAKDTLIFTHNLPNHTVGFSYNEESKTPDLMLAGDKDELHFQKIRPIANDLMQLNSTHKLGKAWNVKNAITSGEFDTGNRFNEAMANLNYTGENRHLTIGAGTLKEYGQFLGASGTGAYQLSDATSSQVTHLAVTQNLPLNSSVKLKYTNFKTEVDMRYDNFANINDLTANEYQLSLTSRQVFGKNDSLNLELIQPFAVTDGTLQQNTVLGYNEAGDYNNVTQNYNLKPANRRQQIRMTWQNQLNLERKTRLFISMQYENHVDNLRDKEQSSILGGISTKF